MVDWRLAERVAEAVAGGDGAGVPLAGGADLDAMAARAREHVTEYARIGTGPRSPACAGLLAKRIALLLPPPRSPPSNCRSDETPFRSLPCLSVGRRHRLNALLPPWCRGAGLGYPTFMPAFICTACGTQYPPSEAAPDACPEPLNRTRP